MKSIIWPLIIVSLLLVIVLGDKAYILLLGGVLAFLIAFFVLRSKAKQKALDEAEKRKKEAEEAAREQAEREAEREAERKAYEEALQKRKNAYSALIEAIPSVDIAIEDSRADLIDTECLADTTNSNITKRTDWNKLGNFVAIDTETTGLRVTCGVLEIAAVRFIDWEPVEKFHSLCSVDKPIPEDATKINHITDDMVAGKPHFRQLTTSLLEFIGADALVGHNIGFDLKFIVRNGADVTSKKRKYYDTLEIAKRSLKKYEDVDNYKLPTLCRYYGIHMPDAHRADCDAIATGLLFKRFAHDRIESMPVIPDIEISE